MASFKFGIQRAKGGYKIVLFSTKNGKLVMSGEVIKSLKEAGETETAVVLSMYKRDFDVHMNVLSEDRKWPSNSGPKKKVTKKAAKKAVKKAAKKKAATHP